LDHDAFHQGKERQSKRKRRVGLLDAGNASLENSNLLSGKTETEQSKKVSLLLEI